MPVQGTVDIPVDLFGGLVIDLNPADLPPGASPDNQDVIYSETGPRTRPGLGTGVFAAIAGTPKINMIKTFEDLEEVLHTLIVDDTGSLWQELPDTAPGVLALVQGSLPAHLLPLPVTAYGREWIAMGDGQVGVHLPRQYDGTNLDRVSQGGPGAVISAGDDGLAYALAAGPNGAIMRAAVNITSISEVGFTVTVITATSLGTELKIGDSVVVAGTVSYNGTWAVTYTNLYNNEFRFTHTASGLAAEAIGTAQSTLVDFVTTAASVGFFIGQSVVIAGVGIAGYNGTWEVRSIASAGPPSFTTAVASTGLAASGGGTATSTGVVDAGVHKVAVCFVTRQGYITMPSPPISFTAAGNKAIRVHIPQGPANVIQRILIFTGAGQSNFFYIPEGQGIASTVIPNNGLTEVVVDFSDVVLYAGVSADYLFKLHVLAECAGVIKYADRMAWWGELNSLDGFVNMGFDGGWNGGVPLGWDIDAADGAGGSKESALSVWLDAYKITGDGATAVRGKIVQTAYQDWAGNPLFKGGSAYSVRARVRRSAGLAAGTFHIDVFSSLGGLPAGLAVTAAQATASYQQFSGAIFLPTSGLPSDIIIRVYVDGTPTNNESFYVDEIEIYPTGAPYLDALRVSYVGDPESFDGVTGLLEPGVGNGQFTRACFQLRDRRLFMVRDTEIYGTQDDGTNEPSGWDTDVVSERVGTFGVRGVAVGEDWAVIGSRAGMYIFWGPEPIKISPEIQPLWDRINWQYAHKLWILVDTQERRLRCGAPVDAATSPSKVLYLDYRDLDTAQDIASSPPIHISYTGRKICRDKARKWSPWNIAANCAAEVARADGTVQTWFGNGTGTGKVYNQDIKTFVYNDDGIAINSYYDTYYVPAIDEEQRLQLRGHRKLLSYLSLFIEGSGTLAVYAKSPGGYFTFPLPQIPLYYPCGKDSEVLLNIPGIERVSFRVQTNKVGNWWRMARFCPSMAPDPWAPVRGVN